MNKAKIQIQKIEVINEGVLFIFYRATNLTTGQKKDSKSDEYYGEDIFLNSSMSESDFRALPTIHGKRYSKQIVISEEVREYSLDDYIYEEELKKEGWADHIEYAISYVIE